MDDVKYGTTYYQVTYADPKLTMPGLKPMVYIGKNIFGNDDEESFYFQDTVSVIVFGLLGEATETENCHVSSFTAEDFGISIVSLDEAAILVAEAAEKANSLGYPKLQKVTGQWKQE
jgi:hypothetical protein